jgi:hypothetical protein
MEKLSRATYRPNVLHERGGKKSLKVDISQYKARHENRQGNQYVKSWQRQRKNNVYAHG